MLIVSDELIWPICFLKNFKFLVQVYCISEKILIIVKLDIPNVHFTVKMYD